MRDFQEVATQIEQAGHEMMAQLGSLHWQTGGSGKSGVYDLQVLAKWDIDLLLSLARQASGQIAVLADGDTPLPEGLVDWIWPKTLSESDFKKFKFNENRTPFATAGKTPALFMDRDGVVNVDYGYVGKTSQVELIEGIGNLVARANQAAYKTIVITNQSGIGRGHYTEAEFHLVMQRVSELLAPARLDDYDFSPHHPQSALEKYCFGRQFRKPRPNMIHRMAQKHGIDLSRSIFIGDRAKDLMAATLAGVGQIFLFASSRELEWLEFQQWLKQIQYQSGSKWAWPEIRQISEFAQIGSL